MSKSILFITPQPFLANRGSPLRVAQTVTSLTRLGFQVDLLAYPFGETPALANISIHRSWKPSSLESVPIGPSWTKIYLDAFLGWKALRLALKKRYLAIHAIEEAVFIAQLLGMITHTPYLADMHSLVPEHLHQSKFISSKHFHRFFHACYSRCLQKASGIVAVSEELHQFAKVIAPNTPCISLEDIPPDFIHERDEQLIAEIKNRYNLHERSVCLYTGNFYDYQGIDLLLEAYALALAKLRTTYTREEQLPLLLLVGESAREVVLHYKSKSAQLGIQNNVIFTGERPQQEMGAFMASANLLVSPRIKGGNTPLKIYCYMASSIPIVATKISSHTQVLSEENSFLAELSASDLADQLLYALDDSPASKQKKRNLAANAKNLVDTRYNKRVFTNQLAHLYNKVLGLSLPLAEEPSLATGLAKSVGG